MVTIIPQRCFHVLAPSNGVSCAYMYVHKMAINKALDCTVYIINKMYCRKFLPLIALIGGDKQLLTMHTSLRNQDMYTMYS